MKNKLGFVVDILLCAALIISLFRCLSSSFDISVKWAWVIIPTVVFCAVYSLLSRLVKKTFTLFTCVTVTLIAFTVSFLFSLSEILPQLSYVLTQILTKYSLYYALPESITLGTKIGTNATGLFVFVSALLSAAFTVSLIRCRKIFVIAALSVALLIPDFILVNTLPETPALLAAVGILFTLWLTRGIRKFRPSQYGAVLLCMMAAVAAVIAAVLVFNPQDTYVRSDWQDSLLASAEEFFGVDSGALSTLDKVQNNLEKTQNLSDVAELKQTHTPKMAVTSTQKSGNMYLFGTAYANYSDNTWSILTDEQKSSYNGESNPFTMTIGSGDGVTTKVHMLNRSSQLYFPYFVNGFSAGCENLYDICMAGSGTDFEYSHSSLSSEATAKWWDEKYLSFVENTYLQIPDDTKSALLETARENGCFDSLTSLYGSDISKSFNIDISELTDYYDTKTIADAVKSVVSQSATYSLDTPKMPSGKDFPVWFLTECDTGYCVHFATSATLLLRSLGVPARYVTGYYFTLTDGTATVTSDNAHAWCEYYLEGTGWVPLECTPSNFTPNVYTGSQSGTYISLDETQAPQSDAEDSANQSTTAQTSTEQTVTEQPTAEQEVTEQSDAEQPATAAQPSTNGEQDYSQSDNSSDGDSNDDGSQNSNSTDGTVSSDFGRNVLTATLLVLLAVVLAIVMIFLRRIIILNIRKKRLYSGTTDKRVMEIYREISKLAQASHIYIPREITAIYERARFSNHKITDDELGKILDFYKTSAANILAYSSLPKRLYLRYVIILR